MKANKIFPFQLFVALFFLYSCGENNKKDKADSDGVESSINMTLSSESEEAKTSFGEGLYEFYVGDFIKSRDLFDAAISADPTFGLAYTYRAYVSQGPKDFASFSKKAEENSEGVTEPEKLLIQINQTFLVNDLERRLSLAETLVEKYPTNFIGRLELSNAYSANNKFEESRKQLLQATKDHPDKARPLMDLAGSYIFEDPKNLAKAEEYAMKAVEVIPDVSSTHIMLGDVFRAQNDLEKALGAYKKAAEVNPQDFVALSKQGHANTFLGNYDDARANYAAADELDDGGVGMLNFMVLTDVYAGNHEGALKKYQDEISKIDGSESSMLNSNLSSLLFSAMMVAYDSGDSEMLATLMPQYKDAQMRVAEDVGTDQIKTSIEAGLKNWDARLAILNKEYESAKQSMNEYADLMESINNPNKMNAYNFGMGMIAMAEGDVSKAIEHLEKVDEQNIYARYHLAKALEIDGQVDRAMEHYSYLSSYNFNGTAYALIREICLSKVNT